MNTVFPSDPDTGVCLAGGISAVPGLSRHHQDAGHVVMEQASVTGKQGKDDNNIGSIITMLITDQTVDLEDYLDDPILSQNGEKVFLTTSIKQEDTLSEAVSPSSSSTSESPFPQNPEMECYFISNDGYKSRTTSLSEGDDENYRTTTEPQNMFRAYNFGPSGLPPSYSRSLYSPLNDMSNYSEKCGDEYVKKDGKYWERRRKNNLAAKKSRDSRRIRENQMRLRVMCLENANQMLKEEMERKEVEISNLKLQLNKYENCQQMFPN